GREPYRNHRAAPPVVVAPAMTTWCARSAARSNERELIRSRAASPSAGARRSDRDLAIDRGGDRLDRDRRDRLGAEVLGLQDDQRPRERSVFLGARRAEQR